MILPSTNPAPSSRPSPSVGVIGLGKLGAPLAALLSARGFKVIGVDRRNAVIAALRKGVMKISEPGLGPVLRRQASHMEFTTDVSHAVRHSDLSLIFVPTPSTARGDYSLKEVLAVLRQIGRVLRHKRQWHLIVLKSTVMPGTAGRILIPLLEKISQKKCGRDFGFCYQPEFAALGNLAKDLTRPDFLIIGESDSRSGKGLANLWLRFCLNRPQVSRMRLVNAEIAKLSINTYVTMKISFANTLLGICQNTAGADVDAVTTAVGQDKRIGLSSFKGGMGFGGPCFPRDTYAFEYAAKRARVSSPLAAASSKVNKTHYQALRLWVKTHLSPGQSLGVLGLTYKPHSPLLTGSFGYALAQSFARNGVKVYAHDPSVSRLPPNRLNTGIILTKTAKDCAHRSGVLVLATPWPEYKRLSLVKKPRTVLDCWRLWNRRIWPKSIRYRAWGRSTAPATGISAPRRIF